MSLLLDTHVLLWWLEDSLRLGAAARDAIADPGAPVYVSAASAWEISIKRVRGGIDLSDEDFSLGMRDSGFSELPITAEHGLNAGTLPLLHRDPFDRLLGAQARIEKLKRVTRDKTLEPYDVDILWA